MKLRGGSLPAGKGGHHRWFRRPEGFVNTNIKHPVTQLIIHFCAVDVKGRCIGVDILTCSYLSEYSWQIDLGHGYFVLTYTETTIYVRFRDK